MQKTTGIICVALGVFLLVRAHKIADSFGSQVKEIFTGAPTDRATYFYAGGIVLVILGVAQFFGPVKKK
jgi:uncharacterized membrane protein